MTDILAHFRVEHPDIALTETVAHDETAVIRPIREAGTDPERNRYLFSVSSEDFDRLEAGLAADPTIAGYERVIQLADEAVYAFAYSDRAILFSTEIGRSNGVILEIENDGTTWLLQVWFPDREHASRLWVFAQDHGVDIELDRINDYESVVESRYGLTETQREALRVALEAGYFDEPRGSTLGDVAAALEISEPAASGLLRRGLKRLVLATIADTEA